MNSNWSDDVRRSMRLGFVHLTLATGLVLPACSPASAPADSGSAPRPMQIEGTWIQWEDLGAGQAPLLSMSFASGGALDVVAATNCRRLRGTWLYSSGKLTLSYSGARARRGTVACDMPNPNTLRLMGSDGATSILRCGPVPPALQRCP